MTSAAIDFRPLPWHQEQWLRLRSSLSAGRLAHALLITGPVGVGKTQLARALAAALLCREPLKDAMACGRCPACLQSGGGSHPSLFWLRREAEQRDIPIDAVRQLCARLAMTSHDGGAKVAVVADAGALNASGFNALLKTLEEPPTGSYLLLLAERPMMIPATVRSRCQLLRCPPPPAEPAMQWLRSQLPKATAEDLKDLLVEAHGAPVLALLLAQTEARAKRRAWVQTLQSLLAGQRSVVEAAAAVLPRADRELAAEFLRWSVGWWTQYAREALQSSSDRNRLLAALTAAQAQVDAIRRLDVNTPPQLDVEAALQACVAARPMPPTAGER